MKTTRLTFSEVRNRIYTGLCTGFQYNNNRWWTVNPETFRVAKLTRNGISCDAYIRANRDNARTPNYSVR